MRSASYFRLLSNLKKAVALFFVVIASLSVASLVFSIKTEIDSYAFAFLIILPLSAYLASRYYRQSLLCCKVDEYKIMLAVLLIAVVVGLLFYVMGLGQLLHNILESNMERRDAVITP